MYKPIYIAIHRQPEENRKIKEDICSKGVDDGILMKLNHITVEEYNFLNKESQWLPKIPKEGQNIQLSYYRDHFLGDFTLDISFTLYDSITLDTIQYPKWRKQGNVYALKFF